MGKSEIIEEMKIAYGMELETVQNYLAASINLDGIHSEVVKRELAADIPTELEHARMLARRIKVLGGTVPGSLDLDRNQESLQPREETTEIIGIIKGVVEAEESAIAQYAKIIRMCEGEDYVTQDLVIDILRDEEEHRREFLGFLKEHERTPKEQRHVA